MTDFATEALPEPSVVNDPSFPRTVLGFEHDPLRSTMWYAVWALSPLTSAVSRPVPFVQASSVAMPLAPPPMDPFHSRLSESASTGLAARTTRRSRAITGVSRRSMGNPQSGRWVRDGARDGKRWAANGRA